MLTLALESSCWGRAFIAEGPQVTNFIVKGKFQIEVFTFVAKSKLTLGTELNETRSTKPIEAEGDSFEGAMVDEARDEDKNRAKLDMQEIWTGKYNIALVNYV